MNVRDLLIALVRNAIKGEALEKEEIAKSLTNEKLATLFKVSKKHDVAHLIAYALEKNGFSFEYEAWGLFKNDISQAKLRYEMMQADINEICTCFEKEGIEYILLKGAIIRQYYPQPWMRTSCDIDILVHEEDLNRAVSLLKRDYSYEVKGKKGYHDISLFSPYGMHLELHYNIKEGIDEYDKILTQVWEFSRSSKENRYKYLQSGEFLIFHLIAHMAYHFINGGCGLRSVLDLWILNKSVKVNKEALGKLLDKAGLGRFCNAMLELGEYWFENINSASESIEETEKFILLGGVYGIRKQGVATSKARADGKFQYLIHRIFMPYERLAIIYPVIKKHKALTPFCQIARWFGAIFKRKKVKAELKALADLNAEQIDKIRALLNYLGL